MFCLNYAVSGVWGGNTKIATGRYAAKISTALPGYDRLKLKLPKHESLTQIRSPPLPNILGAVRMLDR